MLTRIHFYVCSFKCYQSERYLDYRIHKKQILQGRDIFHTLEISHRRRGKQLLIVLITIHRKEQLIEKLDKRVKELDHGIREEERVLEAGKGSCKHKDIMQEHGLRRIGLKGQHRVRKTY